MQPDTPVTLRFVQGSSDKQYTVTLQSNGAAYDVVASWGRTGSTVQTAVKNTSPLQLEEATAVAERLLNEKRRKGYTDQAGGAAYSGCQFAGRDTGIRAQLLEPVAEGQAELLINDPAWGMQEKFNGERRFLVLSPGKRMIGANRNGLEVAVNGDLAELCERRLNITGTTVIDGEDFGSTFAPFDLLVLDGRDLRLLTYAERLKLLTDLIRNAPEFPYPHTYLTDADKRSQYERLRRAGFEGVVFKRMSAPYVAGSGGKQAHQFKDKFVESASCRVIDQNQGKRSVSLELLDASSGTWVFVGNCTVPPNHPVPVRGDLVEIGYLYAMPNGGSLVQPTFGGVRRDIDASSCTTAQLKLKPDAAYSLAS